MRKILVAAAALVALLIVLVLAVPLLIPADAYKQQIIAAVKSATGRDLTIGGRMTQHILPSVELTAQQVALSNMPGSAEPNMLTIGELDVGVKLIPLLSGKIVVDHVTLRQPAIHAEIDKDGRRNWAFTPTAKSAAAPQETTSTAPPAKPKSTLTHLQDLSLGTIKLVDGTVTYDDRRMGKHNELDKIDVDFSLPDLDHKLQFDGKAVWGGKPISLSLSVDDPRGALFTTESPAAMDFEGLGKKFSVKGKLALGASLVGLTDLTLSLDNIKGKGELELATAGAVPSIKGSLTIDALDLNPYLPKVQEPGTAIAPSTAPIVPSAAGWSDAPVDLSALKAVNAALTLSTGSITYRKIEIGKTVLALALNDGRLGVDFKQFVLYNGGGSGRLMLDGSSPGAGLNLAFTASKVAMQPLLEAAIGMDRISGTGDISVDVAGRGRSQREIIGTLGGKGSIHIVSGAVKGIDLSALMKNAAATLEKGLGGGETAFSQLGGSFTIANGIMSNSDLVLVSDMLHVGGAGKVDLPQRSLSYRFDPQVAPGSAGKAGGIDVPIIVEGPWDHLTYRPDLAALLQEKIDSKTLQQTGKGLAQGLLGGSGNGSGKPANILKQLLK